MADLEQVVEQVTKQRSYLFQPGKSGNPLGRQAKKHRIAAKAEELAAEFGGLVSLTAYEKGLLSVVAQIFASPYSSDPPRDLRAAYQAMARLRKNVAERGAGRVLADYLPGARRER
jgi:hypothetical protein